MFGIRIFLTCVYVSSFNSTFCVELVVRGGWGSERQIRSTSLFGRVQNVPDEATGQHRGCSQIVAERLHILREDPKRQAHQEPHRQQNKPTPESYPRARIIG